MKAICISLLMLFCLTATQVKAQGFLDKIDRAADKLDRATNTADRAANKADKAGKVGKKLTGFFGKGKEGEAGLNKTVVKIEGISYEQLNQLNKSLKSCQGVSATNVAFNKNSSKIIVSHAGGSNELLDEMIKKSQGILSKDAIDGVEEGQIDLSIK
ncbi:hypothetical protein [Sphingobacterium sp.]|uniref:hypothetical protein n=1 Tax=Sphingobacterium sp. TaxID=341027 RepID=UPI00289E3073|nr:hypothetical protein [Sphingobacterium sp.]